ncbi:MAG: non-canonical purine NTP pyrophosphatase, partial [Chloroflexota bacterium]
EMRDVPDGERRARFVCSIALAGKFGDSDTTTRRIFEGTADGVITREPRGSHGFGFDPIFLDPASARTFAELKPEEKMARSHRGRALAATRAFLEEYLR